MDSNHLAHKPKKQVRCTRRADLNQWSLDELISNILLKTPRYGLSCVGGPAKTYINQLCADTGYGVDEQPGTIDDRDVWRH